MHASRFWPRLLLAASLLLVASVSDQATVATAQPAKEKETPKNDLNATLPDTKIEFSMDGKPWKDVFTWLTEVTKKPIITVTIPSGSLSFRSPPGARYTIPEVIDIINFGLLANSDTQKYYLLHGEQAFTLIPASEKPDPQLLPHVDVKDLDKRGNSELVRIHMPLKGIVATNIAPEIDKMMGPFGEVIAFEQVNQLTLTDTVGNLKRIVARLEAFMSNADGSAKALSHKCIYIKASKAEAMLKNLMGDPQAIMMNAMRQQQQSRFRGRDDDRDRDRDRDRGDFRGFDPRNFGRPDQQGATPSKDMHFITADYATNTVHVTGPPDKIGQAQDILTKIDVPSPGNTKPRGIPIPQIRTYQVPGGNGQAFAQMLTERYLNAPDVKIMPAGNSAVIVLAPLDDHVDITALLTSDTDQGVKTEVIPTGGLDATGLASMLSSMYGDPTTGAPFIQAQTDTGNLVVRGTVVQVEDVRKSVEAISGGGGLGSGNMRIITLDKGSAATLAEFLERTLPQMRQNPVEVLGPNSAPPKPTPPPLPVPPVGEKDAKLPTRSGFQTVAFQPFADPQGNQPEPAPKDKDTRPGSKDMPVRITAFGNRLIITSNDPEALAMANALIRLATETPAGEGDFEVIHLKNASAVEAAQVLDEAFNGRRQQSRGSSDRGGDSDRGRGGSDFFSRFRGSSNVQTPTNPQENRIRVVADPNTNSLIVRASPLDMLTIRRLLEKGIDPEVSSNIAMRPWTIPMKYARATEAERIIEELYSQKTASRQTQTQSRSSGFGGFFAMQDRGNSENSARAVSLTLSSDDATNTLYMNCSENMFKEIKLLVEEMEAKAQNTKRYVQVLPVDGIDPAMVQAAIYALQGQPVPTSSSRGSSYSGGNQGGFSGFQSGFPGSSGGRPSFFPGGSSGFQGGNFGSGDRGSRGSGDRGSRGSSGRPRGRSGIGPQSRGPDFFEHGVKDDPELNLFEAHQSEPITSPPLFYPVSYQPVQPQPGPNQVQVPQGDVTIAPLTELGGVVVGAMSPEDIQAVMDIIKLLQQRAREADLELRLVPIKNGDATSISNVLTSLFQRVVIGPRGTSLGTALPRTQTFSAGLGFVQSTEAVLSSVVLLPIARQNAIFVAAPRNRMEEILAEIDKLDVPNTPESQLTPIPLRRASAPQVAAQIQAFWATRYPEELGGIHQIRLTVDANSNIIFVQASPVDLAEIKDLVQIIDTSESSAVNDIRIIGLKYALADEVAALLLQALGSAVGPGTTALPGGPGIGQQGAVGVLGQQGLGQQGLGLGQQGLGQQALGQQGRLGQQGAFGQQGITTFPGQITQGTTQARPGVGTTSGFGTINTRASTLRFRTTPGEGPPVFESGYLNDVSILPVFRTNSLILMAPEKTIELILALVRQLDVPPQARAEINIFPLKKADASTTAALLQQFFLGTGQAATFPFALAGPPSEGAPLVDLRIVVDVRTNSLIVAGSQSDMLVVEAIITRLEDTEVSARMHEVYRVRNGTAADMALTLNTYFQNSLAVLQRNQILTALPDVFEREVVVVAEPFTNKLLISATPKFFGEVMRLIEQLDAESPQVVIQVMIAEVDLNGSEEFGVEFGLQTPVLFQRGTYPAPGFDGTTSFSSAEGGVITPGVSVSSTINPTALPGFNFNNPAIPLGNNPAVRPNVIGFQGLGSLGVGRVSPTSGIGGFVFSAASESFNLLIRALKTQGRIDILSRPQVMTLDNQQARVFVGQDFPIILGSNVNLGVITNNVDYRPVGVEMLVTPRIMPDGRVLMRVVPQVSSTSATNVALGNGVFATAINQQIIETTIIAHDGETVAIGGLISKRDTKSENKIPWLGDLPVVGTAFRFRTQTKSKQELLVILTPHVVRNLADAKRILAEESKKMDWIVGDITKIQGMHGMDPILNPDNYIPPGMENGAPGCPAPSPQGPGGFIPEAPIYPPGTPPSPEILPPPASPTPGMPVPPPAPEARNLQGNANQPGVVPTGISTPTITTGNSTPGLPGMYQPTVPAPQGQPGQPPVPPTHQGQPVQAGNGQPVSQGKESRRWGLFRNNN